MNKPKIAIHLRTYLPISNRKNNMSTVSFKLLYSKKLNNALLNSFILHNSFITA